MRSCAEAARYRHSPWGPRSHRRFNKTQEARRMLILSILAFFAAIFLLTAITVAVAWMGFVKQTGEAEAAQEDTDLEWSAGDSTLFRNERLSSFSFWDNLLARFDFIEILKVRMGQAELEWSVGRVTALMLFCATAAGLLLVRILPAW